ncbi:hypothetical protein ACIQUB_08315 [Rhizobium sp. NPDC090275]|uniref:hypothetical protein n=1 Tax=Rhizobium sp. NPDC090275 TaxID=3364498 RepID=UPI00383B6357
MDIVLIEDLTPVGATRNHFVPAMSGGEATRLSVGEILDLYSGDDVVDLVNGATAKTSLVGGDEFILRDSVTGKLSKISLTNYWAQQKWKSIMVGEIYFANTGLLGVDAPPANSSEVAFIELTAGLTGSGGFNNGKLTSESVSGSAPLVVATANIFLSGSPMLGQSVALINTEGRILRPGATANNKQDDAFQGHYHHVNMSSAGGVGAAPQPAATNTANSGVQTDSLATTYPTTDGTNGTPRTANETRMRNISVKAYMRIK